MRITRAAKVAAFPLTALILVALIACQGPAGPAGAAGAKGDSGAPGAPGAPGADAPRNMVPMLKDGMSIGTQYLALEARNADGTAIDAGIGIFNKYEILEVSKYFEDPEGVVNLIYSLADLSDDDEKIVTVSLADTMAEDGGDDGGTANGDIDDDDEMPDHMDAVTGKAYLNISGKAPGSVTLMLTVKDGLPGGTTSQTITVMVRDANAPPVIDTAVLTAAAYGDLSRIGTKRIRSDEETRVMIPTDAFTDGNNDELTITAEVGGTVSEDATPPVGSVRYNKARLDVSVDGNYLVLKPKRGGDNANIPVRLKAMDRYGASAMTGNDATTTPPTATVLVEINTPPMHVPYEASGDTVTVPSGLTAPDGTSGGDPRKLAHLTDKTFSVASNPDATSFITLSTFFVDPDAEDPISGGATDVPARICAFDTSPAGQTYATVTFNTAGEAIMVEAKKRGMFDLSVTCTDNKGEMVTDSVTVTIIQ